MLIDREPEGVSAGELARLIGIPQNTMSAHLAVLSRAGLIVGEHLRIIMSTFERDLTLWMALCIVAGVESGRRVRANV